MTTSAANDYIRVIGIGRDAENPQALVLYFTGKPSDDLMRRTHETLRDGDDDLWRILVAQAVKRLSERGGREPGESDFSLIQRAISAK